MGARPSDIRETVEETLQKTELSGGYGGPRRSGLYGSCPYVCVRVFFDPQPDDPPRNEPDAPPSAHHPPSTTAGPGPASTTTDWIHAATQATCSAERGGSPKGI